MAGLTKAQIEERLRAAEQENERLRAALDARVADRRPDQGAGARRTTSRGRAFLGITLIVLATLLVPVATAMGFAARQASDTDVFVGTLAPLAEDPAVQALIVDRATIAIDDALDTDALVAELLDGVLDEQSTPRLANAADLLGPLLADQARVAIRSALTLVVESDAFATVWEKALQLTHAQLVAVMEADPDGAIAIDDAGVVAIQLGPIIAELKPALVDAGFTLADSIPEVDASITLAEVPSIAQARLGYSLLTSVGGLLPWIAVALLVIGIVVHPRRPRAVVIAGTTLLLTGGILGTAIALGGSVTAAMVATAIPTDATAAIYGGLTGQIAAVMLALVVLGSVMVVAGLISGRSAGAATARRGGSAMLARGSAALDARGWRPEGIPAVLRRHGWLMWLWLGTLAVVLFATLRPLTPWSVLLGTVVLGLAAALYGVLRGTDTPADTPADAHGDQRAPADEHAI